MSIAKTVVHVLRKFEPAEWGGIETHLLGLLPELSSLGYRSLAFAPREAGTNDGPLREIGVPLVTFHAHYPVLGLDARGRRDLVAAGGNLVTFDGLAKLVATPDVAIFHTHTLRRLGAVVRTAARLRRVPYAVTVHGPLRAGGEVIADDPRRRVGLDLGAPFGALLGARRVAEDADLLWVLNRPEQQAWTGPRGGRHLERVAHGVSPSRVTAHDRARAREWLAGRVAADAPPGTPLDASARFVLVVGRLDAPKGQDAALEAFLRLDRPDLRLVFAGPEVDARFASELRARASRAPGRVHLVGGVAPDLARALMAEAELVLVPSRAEPFGIVLLEAWAEGAPALFSAVGGLADLAHDNDAAWGSVACAPGREPVDAWTERLREALVDADGRARERRDGPARVASRYTWRALAERTAEGYERAIAARRSSARVTAPGRRAS